METKGGAITSLIFSGQLSLKGSPDFFRGGDLKTYVKGLLQPDCRILLIYAEVARRQQI